MVLRFSCTSHCFSGMSTKMSVTRLHNHMTVAVTNECKSGANNENIYKIRAVRYSELYGKQITYKIWAINLL